MTDAHRRGVAAAACIFAACAAVVMATARDDPAAAASGGGRLHGEAENARALAPGERRPPEPNLRLRVRIP